MLRWNSCITYVVLGTLTLVLPACHNTQMVGAATQVTGGRVFKASGVFGTIEQQLLLDLQGVAIEPGEFMRNGGLGAPGTMFTLQYSGDGSAHKITTYEFAYSPNSLPQATKQTDISADQPSPDTLCGDGFVTTVGMLLQRIDREAADLAKASLAVAVAKPLGSKVEATKEMAKLVRELKLDETQSTLLLDILDSLGIADAVPGVTDSAKKPAPTGEGKGSDGPPNDDSTKVAAKTPPDSSGAKDAAKSEPESLAKATQAEMAAQTTLNESLKELDRVLASGRNYLIFRWTSETERTAKASPSEKNRFEASRKRGESGFAVAAGVQRHRLLIGRDIDEPYAMIDPHNKLVEWFQDSWSSSGIVTETMEVMSLQYFTKGAFQETVELILSGSPKDLVASLSPEALLSLKIELALTARKLSTYENRAMLTSPNITEESVDWEGMIAKRAPHHRGWTTIAAVATTFKYLEDTGRLDRRAIARRAQANAPPQPTTP